MGIAEQGLEDPTRYTEIQDLVEIDNLIDHLIVKMYYDTGDWGGFKNYFMGRNPEDNKFYFLQLGLRLFRGKSKQEYQRKPDGNRSRRFACSALYKITRKQGIPPAFRRSSPPPYV